MRSITRCLSIIALTLTCSCVHVDRQEIKRDQFEYGQILADSWKRQALVNIVRLKYGDTPMFLDVNSIIESHSTKGSVNGGIDIFESQGTNKLGVEGSREWSNSPTITYQPLTGQKFTRSLLSPIPPVAIFQMLEAGWSAPLIFRTGLRSINGISNQSSGRPADPQFDELVDALERIQRSHALSLRIEATEQGEAIILALQSEAVSQPVARDIKTVGRLLGLREGTSEFTVTFGSVQRNDTEIAMITRSMLELLLEISYTVEVPPEDEASGRVGKLPGPADQLRPLVNVHYSESEPSDTFVAVLYRDHWFWVDDRDWESKSRLTFMMILFSLVESGEGSASPLITVNAGR